jgi:hypothetical protein
LLHTKCFIEKFWKCLCKCYTMAPKKREMICYIRTLLFIEKFWKCLCKCHIQTLPWLKRSEDVYVSVTRWHQSSEKWWIYYFNVSVIVTYERLNFAFYWKFWKCLCKCHIQTLPSLKSSENVYVNVTRWHQSSEKWWIYFFNVSVIVTYEMLYWKVLKMFM